jgi:hypothetical protein
MKDEQIHVTKNGEKIPITALSKTHLLNIIKFIERRAREGVEVISGSVGFDGDEMYAERDIVYGEEALVVLKYDAYLKEARRRRDRPRLYVIGPEGGDEGIYQLVGEDGAELATHYCSDKGLAKGDLVENRPDRIKKYTPKYGDFEVIFLGEDEITFKELLRHNENYMSHKKIQ